jgi:hypothetical protein
MSTILYEVAAQIHPSYLVQIFVITDSKLGLVIDRDVWDALSKLIKLNRSDEPFIKEHNTDSSEATDIMLFDLNHDLVSDYDSLVVFGH